MSGSTTERTVADLIVDLVRRFYGNPGRFRAQALSANEMFGNLDIVLRLALKRPVGPSLAVMRGPVSLAELEREAIFFIRECFFREAATHYEVLGLPKDASHDEVRENFRLLMQLIHPDRHTTEDAWPDALPTRANLAYSVLRTPQSRAAYDRRIGAGVDAIAQHAAPAAKPGQAPVRNASPQPEWHRRKRVLSLPVMPEWMVTHVGGFVRRHPAFTAFGGTISASILAIGLVAWSEYDGINMRVVSIPVEGPAASSRAVSRLAPSFTASAEKDNKGGVIPVSTPATPPSDAVTTSLAHDDPVTAAMPSSESAEVAALVSSFVASFEAGQADAIVELFDNDALANQQYGRTAIRRDYDQLFRVTTSRRMNISLLDVHSNGDHAEANGELRTKLGWRDGRELEQRMKMNMELVRHDGRLVITRLSQSPQ